MTNKPEGINEQYIILCSDMRRVLNGVAELGYSDGIVTLADYLYSCIVQDKPKEDYHGRNN